MIKNRENEFIKLSTSYKLSSWDDGNALKLKAYFSHDRVEIDIKYKQWSRYR